MTIPRTTQNFCQRTTVSEDMDTGIYRRFGEVVGNQYSRRENYTAEDREVLSRASCDAIPFSQLTVSGAERLEVPQEDLQSYRQNSTSEAPGERPYSLKIRNTTSCSSGTYRCTLEDPEGQRNLSGTVILKVTGCSQGRREETFKKYRAEIVLLLTLVIFYLTLIIFTCKFARQQSIFPDFSKPVMEQAFLPVTSPSKQSEPVTLHKTVLV
ncbi:CD83 antigen [Camelus dromedarius]|uniref:CD83 antigen n=1 Tax=Camelus dromedarius TaxID=9838 RepID=A0A5N4CSB7_CAMDR|nr:CD83 antigen [Camelus dromedarius]